MVMGAGVARRHAARWLMVASSVLHKGGEALPSQAVKRHLSSCSRGGVSGEGQGFCRLLVTTTRSQATGVHLPQLLLSSSCQSPQFCSPPLVGSSRAFSSDGASTSASVPDVEMGRRIRNMLRYRSKMRGLLELDLLFNHWVDENLEGLTPLKLRELDEVLAEETPDLWKYVTSQDEAPEHLRDNSVFLELRSQVAAKVAEFSNPAARALPGTMWLGGWDPIQKPGNQPVGNQ